LSSVRSHFARYGHLLQAATDHGAAKTLRSEAARLHADYQAACNRLVVALLPGRFTASASRRSSAMPPKRSMPPQQ
jgi:hypothetical protein